MAVADPTTQQITRSAVSGLGTDEDATLEETSEFVVAAVVVEGRRVEVFGYTRSWTWGGAETYENGNVDAEQYCLETGPPVTVPLAPEPEHDLTDFDWWYEAKFEVARLAQVDRTVLAAGWRLVVDGAEITTGGE